MNTLAERLRSLTPEQRALLELRLLERNASQPGLIPVTARAEDSPVPLSFAQQRLWFLHQLQPDSSLYNTFLTVRLTGRLDFIALERALTEIVRRNEVLRTTFGYENGENSVPVQRIGATAELPLRRLALASIAPANGQTTAQEAVRDEIRRPFDLARGPVIRALLVEIAKDDRILALTMHHIVSDRWSVDVLTRDLAALYSSFSSDSPSPLPPLPIQYADFALWQRSPQRAVLFDQQLAWWKETLHLPLPVADLPFDYPRTAAYCSEGDRIQASLPSGLVDALIQAGRHDGATLFMTMLAATAVLLYRHTEQDEIVVGTPIVNRAAPETAPLIGCFVNTLALRLDGSGNPEWKHFLLRVRSVCLEAYDRQDVPFERLVEELQIDRSLGDLPLFQVMFALNDVHEPLHGRRALQTALIANALTLAPFEVENNSVAADLVIRIERKADSTECVFEYRTALFKRATVAAMVRRFETLLAGMAANPECRLGDLPALTPGERQQLLVQWSRTSAPALPDSSITEMVSSQLRMDPDATAVSGAGPSLTRAELDLRARRLAALLRDKGVGPDITVGVCLDRKPEMVVALLGVLYAGAAYLPLDPSNPPERLAWILEDADAKLVLTISEMASRLGPAGKHVYLDSEPAMQTGIGLQEVGPGHPENLAYVIYTSGSTGRPKGVGVRCQGLLNLVAWHINRYQLGSRERVSQIAAPGFDASVWEIWPALASGAEIFLAPEDDRASAERVWKWLCETRITISFLPTPLAEAVLALPQRAASSLRIMLTGGDRLRNYPASALEFSLVNHYGPTEYTVVTTAGDPLLPSTSAGAPPIGRPIAHTEVFVLDQNLEPAPPGVRGELYVGGPGLARGYHARPDLTAERFIPHPYSSIPGARLYRTGDWARFGSGAMLEFLGRRDGQVKVRGFRVELGEIETVLAAHPDVRECAVVVRDQGGKSLVIAFVVGNAGKSPISEELRQWMSQRLPAYMVPAVCSRLEELPLNANGKVDRRILATLPLEFSGSALAPRTPDEQALAEIWREVLACDAPGAHDDFFALGGHSLLATQLVSRIRLCLGVEIPLRAAFEHSTIAGMAAYVQEARRDAGSASRPGLAARAPEEPLALSFAQRRLWFIAQLEPASPAYNIPFALRMQGDLNIEALRAALYDIVRRHETLHSRFFDHEGQAVLEIAPPAPVVLERYNLSFELPGQRESAARRWCAEEALRPFDLAEGWPLRAALLQLDAFDHVLVLTLHHIAADGWSIAILAREFAALYRASCRGEASPLPELKMRFSDYAAWQNKWLNSEALGNLLHHWRGQLEGSEPLELLHDHPRPPAASYRASAVPFTIEPEPWSALRRIAQDEGATGFMLLFAAWALLLSRYSGQSDIVVGTDIAGRDQAETEDLIGCFVNQLALRLIIRSTDTFRQLLQRARTVLIDAYTHQSLPFETLVEALAPARDLSRHPLFQCKLALEEPVLPIDLPDLETSLFAAGSPTIKTDLRMAARLAGGGATGRIEFALDLFEPATVQRMVARFTVLLASAASAPDHAVLALPLMSAEEQRAILASAQGGREEFPRVAVHDLFERRVAELPDAPAVTCQGRSWSYSELNARANALASVLIRLGARPETRVGLCLDRDEHAVLALLAVLKTGAAYVPMDPAFPPERLAFLAQAAGVAVILTAHRCRSALEGSAAHVLCLEDCRERVFVDTPVERPHVNPENLAYVIFTSGSTGTPKAVGIEHRNLVNYILAVSAKLAPVRGARFALLSTLAADLGNTTLFASLCGGGTLHVIPEDLASHPDDLAAYFHEHSIACVKIAPSHLALLLSARSPAHVLPETLLVLGGEASSWTWIRELRALRPQCRILNHYGPTETTVGALTMEVQEPETPSTLTLPLGTPLSNISAYVLDTEGRLTPDGIPGELYLGGAGVARAYLGAPAQTAERFLPDPFSDSPGARLYRTGDRARSSSSGGVIEFLGRTDRQVKIRGYRVEPGEIEAALNQHPEVAQSAVAVVEDRQRGAYVAAWFAPAPGRTPKARDLRNFLESCLPAYMLPAAFVLVPSLPLLANGKLNRHALPNPSPGEHSAEESAELRTPTEQLLAAIWESVLDIDQVGRAHNFFELGGHSLLATRVAARIREALNVPLGVRAVFECRTLEELAARIDAGRSSALRHTPPPLVCMPREEPLPLSFSEQRLWFLQRFAPEDRSYLVPIVVRLSGELSVSALERAFSETVRRHEILRTCFPTSGDLPVRSISSFDGWTVPVADLRATPGSVTPSSATPGSVSDEVFCRIRSEVDQPFDLGRGPLLRTRLYRTGELEHVLLVLLHHIISDAWSSGVLLAEICALYQNQDALPPLPLQYSDFACWQRDWLHGPALDELRDWWQTRLQHAPALELPADRRPLAVRSAHGSSCSTTLDPDLTRALKSCARAAGATDFMVLLSGLAAVLARFSGHTDISIGTAVSGRVHAALDPLLGCFVNTLVLRCRLEGDPTFLEILSRVRETTLAAWDHQELPFEKLVEDLQPSRTSQATPFFQVMFVLQNAPRPEVEIGGLRFQQIALQTETAKFDLTLIVHEVRGHAGELSYVARLEYRTDLFERDTIQQMLNSLRCVLASAVRAPEQRLSSLELLDPGQKENLLAQARASLPYSRLHAVHLGFVERVRRNPAAIALEFGDRTMDYGTLNCRANQLAHYLCSLGAGPEVLVAVCMERSVELIVTLLAVLKAGAAYLPLDPSEPASRLSFVLAETAAPIAVTVSKLADQIRTAGATKLVLVDSDSQTIGRQEETDPEAQAGPAQLAYVMYTSGSMGTPKGVAVTHRAILRLVDGNDYVALASSDTLLQLAPFGFDASTFEIWGSLLNGAKLAIFPASTPSLAEIGSFLVRYRITTLWLTAGLFRLIVDEQIASLRGVSQLLAGGDILPMAQIRRVAEELPGCRLINGYGPTENTTFTCCHTVQSADLERTSIPIGRAITHTEALVLDENMELTPPGARGELYAGGDGLARGYYARPDLTAEAFVPHPFSSVPGARLYRTGDMVRQRHDGVIEFLGRRDGQIKIRGFRVEVSEIEAVLRRHPTVRDAAVIVREDAQGNRILVAYVAVEKTGLPAETKDLRDWLLQQLPAYMMPAAVVARDRLPLTPNGKTDRRSLASELLDFSGSRDEFVAPRTPDEQALAEIWTEIFGREHVSIHSNFFALGGHSLLAAQLAAKTERKLGIVVPLRVIFENPTIADLAEAIEVLRWMATQSRET